MTDAPVQLCFSVAVHADLSELDQHPAQDGVLCDHKASIADADGVLLLAHKAGTMVGHGFIRFTGFRLPALKAQLPDHAILLSVCVWPRSNHGNGIGAAIVRELERVALERGRTKIALPVLVDNKNVHSFYERLGYESVKAGPLTGTHGDVILFHKTLD